MRRIIKIVTITILIFQYSWNGMSQEQEQVADPKKRFEETLKYGIDESVISVLKEITELELKGYEDLILQRIKKSQNENLISSGIIYFRELEIQSDALIDFCLNILKAFEDYTRKTVQYAGFYISDYVDSLDTYTQDLLIENILQISESDQAGIVLAALELLSKFYTEKDIPYTEKTEEEGVVQSTVKSVGSTEAKKPSAGNEENKGETRNELVSDELIRIYQDTNFPIIQDQILLTLGEIQANNQVNFIIEIATDEANTKSMRSRAIKALSYFEKIPSEKKNEIYELYESLKHSDVPDIRSAVIEGSEIILLRNFDEKYFANITDSLQDNEMSTRMQALKSLHTLYSEHDVLKKDEEILNSVKYMVKYEPEVEVKKEAIRTLAILNKGNEFIAKEIAQINFLTPEGKVFIDSGFKDIAKEGGVEALENLVKISIEKKRDSLIDYIANTMSKYPNDNLSNIVGMLLEYTNPNVTINCLNTIAKNKITLYNDKIQRLSKDISQSSAVRTKARETLIILAQ